MGTDLRLILSFLILTGIACSFAAGVPSSWKVTSPDGGCAIELTLRSLGEADYPSHTARLYWRAFFRGKPAVSYSPLGLLRGDSDFIDGLVFEKAGKERKIEEEYRLLHGKRKVCRVSAAEKTITFRNPAGGRLEVVLRAQSDGVAFRYGFPETSAGLYTVRRELTGFRLPEDGAVWLHPYDKASKYTPAYETYYKNEAPVGTPAPGREGWAFPVLFRNGDGSVWGLLTEAGLDASYCGCHLESEIRNGVYRIRFPDPGEGNGTGSVEPSWRLPWIMPWRVVILGGSPAAIVESTMVTDLSSPCAVSDTSWIRPGRASWSWLSDHDSPQDYNKLMTFIDLAAEMGWEYTLIDANWTIMKNGTIHDLIRYVKRKKVGVLLWYNSGGPHNTVTEKPRGLMYSREVRRHELALLKKWGAAGVKVDFFQSDKQNVIKLYLDILKDAAEIGLMVNFHGCTLPRGWTRTYPHLMGMEGVKGEECYSFDERFTDEAPRHNTILPFTRNAVGPMDYTPVMFINNVYPHKTTWAHELGLAVVFECGWVHFADRVSAYLNLPEEPRRFLEDVPTAWDDTKCLAAEPGRFVMIARRKGREWFVGAVNGEGRERTVDFSLLFLPPGRYALTLISDGTPSNHFKVTRKEVSASAALPVTVRPYGGFAARVVPE